MPLCLRGWRDGFQNERYVCFLEDEKRRKNNKKKEEGISRYIFRNIQSTNEKHPSGEELTSRQFSSSKKFCSKISKEFYYDIVKLLYITPQMLYRVSFGNVM